MKLTKTLLILAFSWLLVSCNAGTGDNTAPGGDAVPPAGDTTAPEGEVVPPAGDTAPPAGDMTTPEGEASPEASPQ